MNRFFFWVPVLAFASCRYQKPITTVDYLNNGQTCNQKIPADIIKNGKINSAFIKSLQFSILDSISFPDKNPDRKKLYSTPVAVDFSKRIKRHSEAYYSVYTAYNIDKAIKYYNKLFENKIDFNSQEDYREISVLYGDIPLLTSPKEFIIQPGGQPSPSLFYHEMGHRAFWYLQDRLNIKFGGLTYIHMGLLEYFTVSLNNSPVVGEDFVPSNLIRDASRLCQYPAADSLYIGSFFDKLKAFYKSELENEHNNISKYYYLSVSRYQKYFANVLDNHRAGLIITSTLWRIRQKLGKDKTDRLVAQTILGLNSFFDRRDQFYRAGKEESSSAKIEWFDLYYGLIQTDKALYNGENQLVIEKEFKTTGFPVESVKK
ncbi:hypothetical protein [Filimonas effusa]|uniref:Uncharacterized protein n=1 Tax=Filimonas effusa TaxID=2508721 RepID=A0A4Q1DCH8_9BACT|nr:hypothetical protein [Filimonas effusa]RXK86239.1 hypothetical protein ESB13_05375 [Filimonas effusa]